MYSVGQQFRQNKPGVTHLCSPISKVLSGKISMLEITVGGWNHLKAALHSCLVPEMRKHEC